MHYKNGREVKVGDWAMGKDSMGHPVSGIVVECLSNCGDTCNAYIIPTSVVYKEKNIISVKDFMHTEDMTEI